MSQKRWAAHVVYRGLLFSHAIACYGTIQSSLSGMFPVVLEILGGQAAKPRVRGDTPRTSPLARYRPVSADAM